MKISKEIKIAVLVIAGIIFLIFGINFLKGENLFSSSRTFYVNYKNVEGLTLSTPVTISGLHVGNVKDIKLKEDATLVVTLIIDNDYTFSKNSTAELYDTSLIGGKSIAIMPALDNAELAESGDYLVASRKSGLTDIVGERLAPLQEKIESLTQNADSLLYSFNGIFDEKTTTNLKNSIAGLEQTIASFNATSKSINSILTSNKDNINNTLTNLNHTSDNFSKLSDSLAATNISGIVNNLEQSLASFNGVLNDVNNGKGSLGKLLKDDQLYENIEGASLQLEQLLQDMKLNPKRYVHFSVFGKKPKDFDAEENQVDDNGTAVDVETTNN
ncbi:MlaD family protein [Formosa algae]|uniref:Phospholipid/cholesterol/gamma-HCH transport system substrate-binding protein n=1 Tax=Formosa algae TaxID=225843 RepID=A0A9X1CDC0_9FLAO|nr:MlaD family protein [Formosa algae]MBP1841160.1 phospholipid/cholesterol/gamma-HCH transport system substrate-binding protein [Formosa algae]MDQ0336420.1 phospholipid/cholesterol/gamma-HCH transport system substrate-binding protein [Formosa algae]OEI81384.1 ABC transporter substrate-binding protein [Formosa algae]